MKGNSLSTTAHRKAIWVDLDNSPHVPFFKPIILALEKRGFSIALTARDSFQVSGLIELLGLNCTPIGRHYGKNKIMKVLGVMIRALQLAPTIIPEKPDLAVSHGSRAQLLLATCLRIPTLVIFDYEYAKGLGFIHPDWVMAPEIIPSHSISLPSHRVLRYPGIKEDVYVPNFHPDPSILKHLEIGDGECIVTVRPPANEAHYHNPESERLLQEVIEYLCEEPNTKVILLPRTDKQGSAIRESWPELFSAGRIMIPNHVIEGLNLMWFSDLVVSGGGTMNREAAALGVPVYSIFRGTIGAVDRYLVSMGRLVLIESVEDVRRRIILKKRIRPTEPANLTGAALESIVENIVGVLEASQT